MAGVALHAVHVETDVDHRDLGLLRQQVLLDHALKRDQLMHRAAGEVDVHLVALPHDVAERVPPRGSQVAVAGARVVARLQVVRQLYVGAAGRTRGRLLRILVHRAERQLPRIRGRRAVTVRALDLDRRRDRADQLPRAVNVDRRVAVLAQEALVGVEVRVELPVVLAVQLLLRAAVRAPRRRIRGLHQALIGDAECTSGLPGAAPCVGSPPWWTPLLAYGTWHALQPKPR